MNATEQMAYQWLREHGADEESIIFQSHKSPDFITSIGKFEVKKSEGRAVSITKEQVKLLETDNITFLVYTDGTNQPSKLSFNELKGQFKIIVNSGQESNEDKQFVGFWCPRTLLNLFDEAIKGTYNHRTEALLDRMRDLIRKVEEQK